MPVPGHAEERAEVHQLQRPRVRPRSPRPLGPPPRGRFGTLNARDRSIESSRDAPDAAPPFPPPRLPPRPPLTRYVKRKLREEFHKNSGLVGEDARAAIAKAKADRGLIDRQVEVYRMFGSPQRSILDAPPPRK